MEQHDSRRSPYPRGSIHINWFSLFNALAFQVVVGPPMILYAKSLGANATVLGVIAALPYLLGTLQAPGNHFLGHIGYRRMIFTAWELRIAMTFLVALVPLFAFLNPSGKIWLLLAALFVFHLVRGITVGAWLPWLTDLIPAAVRGRFLSRDQVFVHVGSLVALLASGLALEEKSHAAEFAAIFFMAAFASCASLFFVRYVPEVEHHETQQKSNTRVPWREILTHPPFLRLAIFNVLFVFATSTVNVFTVPFLKTKIGFSESDILFLSMLYFFGAMLSLPLVGRMLDRTGSKVILNFSLALWAVVLAGWTATASGLVAPSFAFIALLQFTGGVAGSNLGLANIRLMLHTMPHMGRSHFLALFSVITSVALGLAPIVWGGALDAMNRFSAATGPVRWDRFGVWFFGQLALAIAALAFAGFLHEEKSRD